MILRPLAKSRLTAYFHEHGSDWLWRHYGPVTKST